MAYKDFTLEKLESEFGISNQRAVLFSEIMPVPPSQWLTQTLAMGRALPLRTEKARSELLITPVLLEVKNLANTFITIHSGERLNADPQHGLVGECDFILSQDTNAITIQAPLFTIVEAKRQDFDLGVDQCAAQLLGARIFNEKRSKQLPFLYGCVTTGDDWIFLKLENNTLYIDFTLHPISNLPHLIGIFQN
nr:hypothetical protein [Spirosomataceae bacterium]